MSAQTETSLKETIQTKGNELLAQIERVLHEGDVRKIVVREDERVIAEFPLAVGVVGALLAPALAALGALAALLGDCTIDIERAEAAPATETATLPAASEPPTGGPIASATSVAQPVSPPNAA